jgi:lysophospholipase L1-like esterase
MTKKSTSRSMRVWAGAVVIAVVTVVGCVSGGVASASRADVVRWQDGEGNFAPPKAFYLSLGDSTAFGLQWDRVYEMLDAGTYSPDAFNTGYTDVLAARMRRLRPDQQMVNMSCPGEDTNTMINGGCFWTSDPEGPGLPIHTSYSKQLDAAVSFLRSHRGQVSPVTVSMGVNDVANMIDACNFDAACVGQSGVRDSLARNLNHILRALRAAAPETEMLLMVFYSPFAISNPETNELWQRDYTAVENDVARRNGVRVVDVAKTIPLTEMCRLTFACGSGDAHPNDTGYRLIADQIFDVAGYRHLEKGNHPFNCSADRGDRQSSRHRGATLRWQDGRGDGRWHRR